MNTLANHRRCRHNSGQRGSLYESTAPPSYSALRGEILSRKGGLDLPYPRFPYVLDIRVGIRILFRDDGSRRRRHVHESRWSRRRAPNRLCRIRRNLCSYFYARRRGCDWLVS